MKKRNELKVNNDYYLQNEIIEIDNYCDKKGILDNQKKRMATLAAYLMKHNENESDNTIDDEDFVSDLKLAKEFLKDEIIFVNEMKRDFNEDALKAYFNNIVRLKMKCQPIEKLGENLLDIKDGEKVADFKSKDGEFISYAASRTPKAYYYGYDNHKEMNLIARNKLKLQNVNFDIEDSDVLKTELNQKYDKIFSNYTFENRVEDKDVYKGEVEIFASKMHIIPRNITSTWLRFDKTVESLKQNGKAIFVMSSVYSDRKFEQQIRKNYVDKGNIEAVIKLPDKMFENVRSKILIFVISSGNTSIKMVDASNFYEKGRRLNSLSDDNIDSIRNLLKVDGDKSITVDYNTLEKNDFILNPMRYLNAKNDFSNGVEFKMLTKRVTRGRHIRAEELDFMYSDEPTDFQYLTISNIDEGMLTDDMQYLKEIDSRYERYCVKNNNLLLSKNGNPFRYAVVNLEEGKKILVSDNFYIIELDEKVVNPYYIEAFFNSEIGNEMLQNSSVGDRISNISQEDLNKIVIPLPDMEIQNKIAETYRVKLDKLAQLKKQVKDIRNELVEVFDLLNEK